MYILHTDVLPTSISHLTSPNPSLVSTKLSHICVYSFCFGSTKITQGYMGSELATGV